MANRFPASILVTGGAGFVGSTLAIYLKNCAPGSKIVCMDNLHRKGSELNVPRLQENGIDFHRGDIRNSADFPKGPFEVVLECSAEPSVLAGYDGSPDFVFETNLDGTYRCLERAREWKSTVVFFSTSRVYPVPLLEMQPWVEKETRFEWQYSSPGVTSRGVSEALPMEGHKSLYGFTKYASEGLIEEYRAGFGLRAVVNRCSLLSGPWQMGKAEQGIIAHWLFGHYFGAPLKYIGYGGTGKQVRDVLHIDDLCELVKMQLLELEKWDGWRGNVGGGAGNTFSLLELTKVCQEKIGRETVIGSDPANRPMDLRIFYADCGMLYEKTLWRPRRGVEHVVSDMVTWIGQNEAALESLLKE